VVWHRQAGDFKLELIKHAHISNRYTASVTDTKIWDQLKLIDFEPKKFEDYDIDIKIEYCGVCGSDVSQFSSLHSPSRPIYAHISRCIPLLGGGSTSCS
jgi:hypothetical protein